MKNLKLTLLLFGLCALITTQLTFAQEDAKTVKKGELNQMTLHTVENETAKAQDLKELYKRYDDASDEDRVAIQKEITIAKKAHYEQLQKASAEKAYQAGVEKDIDFSEREAFIKNSKMRLSVAKDKLASDIENGNLSEMEEKNMKKRIAKVEEKIRSHMASLHEAKLILSK